MRGSGCRKACDADDVAASNDSARPSDRETKRTVTPSISISPIRARPNRLLIAPLHAANPQLDSQKLL